MSVNNLFENILSVAPANSADDLAPLRARLESEDERTLLSALEELGRLPVGFDARWLLPLLRHPAPDVRLLAIKNIGNAKDASLFVELRHFAIGENNTLVRREAVSAIGRLRTGRAVPTLVNFLHDQDAKIVLQALRALLPFRDYPKVQDAFKFLQEHPNELIQDALAKANATPLPRAAKDEAHTVSPHLLRNLLVCGDVREVLSCMEGAP